VLALLALFLGGEARAQEIALAAPASARTAPQSRVERYTGGGGGRADGDLRRRLDVEERRAKETMDDLHEREIMGLFRECTTIPSFVERPDPSHDPSPSAAFLRAVTPDRQDLRPLVRRGLDRVLEREVHRAWRREWKRDLPTREGAFSVIDSQEALDRAVYDFEAAARPGARAPFPRYWEGHPGAEALSPRVEGERIEVLRVGALSLDNELSIRGDLAPERAPSDPRGGLYSSSVCTVDAGLHVSGALASPETAFVREVRAKVDCSFFGTRDRVPLASVEVQAEFEPRTSGWTVSVMLDLVKW